MCAPERVGVVERVAGEEVQVHDGGPVPVRRDRVDAVIDPGAGIEIVAPVGATVRAGEPVMMCGAADEARLAAGLAQLDGAVTIG